jgi:hypothetical protein
VLPRGPVGHLPRTLENQYFTLSVTFNKLVQRIDEYTQTSLPPGCHAIRPIAGPPIDIWGLDGESALGWRWDFNTISTEYVEVPLFELGVQQRHGTCRVRARCRDPKAEDWFNAMLDWLAPGRPKEQVLRPPQETVQSADTSSLSPLPGGDAAAPALQSETTPATGQAPEPAKVRPPSRVRREGSKPRGRKSGKKNWPPAERDRLCKEYEDHKGTVKFENFWKAHNLVESTFAHWLRDYRIRHGIPLSGSRSLRCG